MQTFSGWFVSSWKMKQAQPAAAAGKLLRLETLEKKMEKAITKIIFACIFVVGVFGVWILRGRTGSLKSEFNESHRRRNGMLFLVLLTALIGAVIYINNK